jgi:D-alanyl-D-alanine carboxypeptidase
MHWRRGGVAALCAFVLCTALAVPAGAQELPPDVTSKLEALVEHVNDLNVPGVVLGVNVPGVGHFAAASGTVSGTEDTPVGLDSHFRIGSITKTFVATVALQLVGECKLALDDTIERWQPTVGDADQITIEELLHHTSGIPDYQQTDQFQQELFAYPFRVWNHQDLVSLIAGQPPAFPPGTQYQYSNSNYLLLGLIIEAVTGQTLEHELEQRIFTPLGLDDTSLPTTPDIPSPATGGTDILDDENKGALIEAVPFNFDPSGVWAAGAMISTLADLEVWARALATGELLSPALQARRLSFVPIGGAFESFPTFPGPNLTLDYGLGIMSAGGFLGHNGEVIGFEAMMVHEPRTGVTIVELENATVSFGVPRDPASDQDVPIPDFVLPSVVGILDLEPAPPPTEPPAPLLSCPAPPAPHPTRSVPLTASPAPPLRAAPRFTG